MVAQGLDSLYVFCDSLFCCRRFAGSRRLTLGLCAVAVVFGPLVSLGGAITLSSEVQLLGPEVYFSTKQK